MKENNMQYLESEDSSSGTEVDDSSLSQRQQLLSSLSESGALKTNRSPSSSENSAKRNLSISESSLNQSLAFSQHLANNGTNIEEIEQKSYSDTFDSLESESDSGNSKSYLDKASSSKSDRFASDQTRSEHPHTSKSDERYSSGEDYDFKDDNKGPTSNHLEDTSISNSNLSLSLEEEMSDERVYSSQVESLSLSVSSGRSSDSSTHLFSDKLKSADGEIVYYSDFDLEALTARSARQLTHRSENSEILKSDGESALDDFITKKMQLLKQTKKSHEAMKPPLTFEDLKGDLKTLNASEEMKTFCSKKLNFLKKKNMNLGTPKISCTKHSSFLGRLDDDVDVVTYGIPLSAVQRLQCDRLCMIDFHELNKCPRCRLELGDLALSEFVLAKAANVREQLIARKLDSAKTNSMYGMKIAGEILAKVSQLNQQPKLAMQHLMEELVNRKTSFSAEDL